MDSDKNHPSLLWHFCDSVFIYKYPILLTYNCNNENVKNNNC